MELGHVVCIVQARMGSSRLPGKIMLKLSDRHIFKWVFDRLSCSTMIDQIVFATSTSMVDNGFCDYLTKFDIKFIRGSELNVLERFYDAAVEYKADTIIRVTCDCPLVDAKLIDEGLLLHSKNECHYTSNVIPPSFPDGFDFEIFSFEALDSAFKNAFSNEELEHVTTWIINNINNKNIIRHHSNKQKHAYKRVTLDTQADFDLLDQLVKHYGVTLNSSVEEIIAILETNPELQEINKEFNVRKI